MLKERTEGDDSLSTRYCTNMDTVSTVWNNLSCSVIATAETLQVMLKNTTGGKKSKCRQSIGHWTPIWGIVCFQVESLQVFIRTCTAVKNNVFTFQIDRNTVCQMTVKRFSIRFLYCTCFSLLLIYIVQNSPPSFSHSHIFSLELWLEMCLTWPLPTSLPDHSKQRRFEYFLKECWVSDGRIGFCQVRTLFRIYQSAHTTSLCIVQTKIFLCGKTAKASGSAFNAPGSQWNFCSRDTNVRSHGSCCYHVTAVRHFD